MSYTNLKEKENSNFFIENCNCIHEKLFFFCCRVIEEESEVEGSDGENSDDYQKEVTRSKRRRPCTPAVKRSKARNPFNVTVSSNDESQNQEGPMMSEKSALSSDKMATIQWSQSVKQSDLDNLYACLEK